MRSVTEGRLGRYRCSIVRNVYEQRAPLSPHAARHFPRLGRGKLHAVNRKPPLPQRGRWHAQRDGGGALNAQGYVLIEMESNNL